MEPSDVLMLQGKEGASKGDGAGVAREAGEEEGVVQGRGRRCPEANAAGVSR